MKTIMMLFFLVCASFVVLAPLPARAAGEETTKINESTEVFRQIMSIPEKGIPPALLNTAKGIAIIPGMIKAGFIIGGRHGSGIVVIRNDDSGWSNPAFITLTGGSIGWQIGVQSTDIILVFKGSRGIDNIMKGKFTLGADAAVAAGPVGRQAEAATDIELKVEIYSYSRSKGLFAGISLEGSGLQLDDDANVAFYNAGLAHSPEIFTTKALKAPEAVSRLKKNLSEHTGN